MSRITRLGVCESCNRWSWGSLGEICPFCGIATVVATFAESELAELDLDQLLGSHSVAHDED
ncbi:MAG: hypothetical protein H6807_02070 [Planctomycetes bacterium]|nr:hypothetical protein [Planctomycetota bacterium]